MRKPIGVMLGIVLGTCLCSCAGPQGDYANAKADKLRADQARAGEAVRDLPILPDVTKGATSSDQYGRPR